MQEAEDLRLAMQLSQEMNDDNGFEDEFDQFINKPSDAFQLENSKSRIFDDGDIPKNEVFQPQVEYSSQKHFQDMSDHILRNLGM